MSLFSGDPANTKCKSAEDLHSVLGEERLRKDDVTTCVRVAEALENENEPTWKEVKQMKDILGKAAGIRVHTAGAKSLRKEAREKKHPQMSSNPLTLWAKAQSKKGFKLLTSAAQHD